MQRYMGSPVLAQVLLERQRQIDAEGFDSDHDDQHTAGELARAAACYTLGSISARGHLSLRELELCSVIDRLWPWSPDWWKPRDARRDLIRAAALIVAELERLDRLAGAPSPQPLTPFTGLGVLKLEPGDRYVLRVPQHLSADHRSHMRAAWQQFAGDTPVLILDGGTSLDVMRVGVDPAKGPDFTGGV